MANSDPVSVTDSPIVSAGVSRSLVFARRPVTVTVTESVCHAAVGQWADQSQAGQAQVNLYSQTHLG